MGRTQVPASRGEICRGRVAERAGKPLPPHGEGNWALGGAPPAAVGEALLRPLALTRAPTVARQPLLPSCAPAPSRSLSSQADVTTKILKGASLH